MRIHTWKITVPCAMLAALTLSDKTALAEPQVCGDAFLATFNEANQLTMSLKIANFRADVAYMQEVMAELSRLLNQCGGEAAEDHAERDVSTFSETELHELGLVCGFECHAQLARYYLFMASDFQLLTDKSVGPSNDPEEMLQYFNRGLNVVNRGIYLLSRQQNGTGGGLTDDSEAAEQSFRSYISQLAQLNSFRIRLYMAAGDAWYQGASDLATKHLGYTVESVLDAGSSADGTGADQNLYFATTNYEEGLWALVEAQTDIPKNPTFDPLRAEMQTLGLELRERTESIRRGFLFLNIDPASYTSIDFDELVAQLNELVNHADIVESKIHGIVEQWASKTNLDEMRQIDERRFVQSQQANLSGHKIAELQDLAERHRLEVNGELLELGENKEAFSYHHKIAELRFELESRLRQMQIEKQRIAHRQADQLIVLSKESLQEQRAELRWMINFSITKMNLELQQAALEQQVIDYTRQTERNETDLETLKKQIAVKEEERSIANADRDNALERIGMFEQQQGDIYFFQRQATIDEICSLETELAYYGEEGFLPGDEAFAPELEGELACDVPGLGEIPTQRDFHEKVCGEDGLRAKLLDAQIDHQQFVADCILGTGNGGSDCDAAGLTGTEKQYLEDIWAKEQELLEKERAVVENAKKRISDTIDDLDVKMRTLEYTLQGVGAVVDGAAASFTALSAVPCTGTMGPFPIFEVDPGDLARAIYTTASAVYNRLAQGLRFEFEHQNRMAALQREVDKLKDQLAVYDVQKKVKEYHHQRAMFQILGESAKIDNHVKEFLIQKDLTVAQCGRDQNLIEAAIQRAMHQHRRLMNTLELEGAKNALNDNQINIAQRQKEQAVARATMAELQIAEYEIRKEALEADIGRIGEIIANIEGRNERIGVTMAEITEWGAESDEVAIALENLREQQRQDLLGITEAEFAYLEESLAAETDRVDEMTANFTDVIDIIGEETGLRQRLREFELDVKETIAGERATILDTMSELAESDPDEKRDLFMASEAALADLLKGIPEFIASKRKTVQSANVLVNLLNKRYATLTALTGQPTLVDDEVLYLRTADSLRERVNTVRLERFLNETLVDITVTPVKIPAQSGLGRQLALKRRAKFEIAPIDGDLEAVRAGMAEDGYFRLWDPEFNNPNLVLVDIVATVSSFSCEENRVVNYRLFHQGDGWIFTPISEHGSELAPRIVSGPERFGKHNLLKIGDDESSGFFNSTWQPFWTTSNYRVRTFPNERQTPRGTLEYLGLPLTGTYEMVIDPTAVCGVNGASVTMHFAYARRGFWQ